MSHLLTKKKYRAQPCSEFRKLYSALYYCSEVKGETVMTEAEKANCNRDEVSGKGDGPHEVGQNM